MRLRLTVLALFAASAAFAAVDSRYLVIDLSSGPRATRYKVSSLASAPSGGWSDAYKTTKLVLRRIEPGSFKMSYKNVTISQPFYAGVFEVTQKQYELVTGFNPSPYKGDKRPVEFVEYETIRGAKAGAQWPKSAAVDPDSFMGRLRARTGLDGLDLPTEAQWEYACRAGSTAAFCNGGTTEADLKKLGRYYENRADGRGGYKDAHTTVGSYEPNAWGLYDMHGNVWEWCLDWYGEVSDATDPVGPQTGEFRIYRGGSWSRDMPFSSASHRAYRPPAYPFDGYGFRVFCSAGVQARK